MLTWVDSRQSKYYNLNIIKKYYLDFFLVKLCFYKSLGLFVCLQSELDHIRSTPVLFNFFSLEKILAIFEHFLREKNNLI
jgi:hypothetical protein